MFKRKIKQIETSDKEINVATDKNYNEDKTMAFRLKKVAHKKDSIAWLVGSILAIIFLIMSVGRLTVVGMFFDDVFFNLIFGWFKFVVYAALFGVAISILIGLKYKFKKRFVGMVIITSLIFCWFISTSLFIDMNVKGEHNVELWQKDMFPNTMKAYTDNWLDDSIFGDVFKADANSKFGIWKHGYASLYSGGGLPGALMTAIVGYLSLPMSLILAVFCLALDLMWILTGNPLYLLLPKQKRRGKGVRILSLKYNDNPYSAKDSNFEELDAIEQSANSSNKNWDNVNIFNTNAEDINRLEKEADVTIGFRNKEPMIEDTFEFDTDDADMKEYLVGSESDDMIDVNAELQRQREEMKKSFEDLNPDEARAKFEKEVSSARPYGNIQKTTTIKSFNSYEEEVIDDDEFFDELFGNNKDEKSVSIETDSKKPLPIVKPEPIKEEKEKEPFFEKINKHYKLPSIDLLNDPKASDETIAKAKEEAKEKAEKINNVFEEFKVDAKVINVITGPTVTKFEIEPAPGTRVSDITKLSDNLKLALASQDVILEAPIQGKNLVGIEIASSNPTMVTMKELITNAPKDKKDSKLLFTLGKNVLGKPVFGELNKMPHALVAGSTGSGKSVMINTLIISILLRAKPNEVKFLMIDPKKVELSVYTKIPHMLAPVINDMKKANNALKLVIAEMDRRFDVFAETGSKNIEGYNAKQPESKRLPYYVVIIDELADLMMTADKAEVEASIMRITQLARAAGIHMVVATQRPSVDIITGVIKSNIPSRIAFRVTSNADSRTILDQVGAEKLIGRGDMLYTPPGSSSLERAQGAYLSDEEIEAVVNAIVEQQEVEYYDNFLELDNPTSTVGVNGSSEKDEMYDQIVDFAIANDGISTSLIQRKFSIGYNRAANIIDQMEAAGIIGPNNGSKPREILVNKK